MTPAAALLAGSVVVAVLMPRLLWRLHRLAVDPLLLLAGWTLSVIGVLATAIASVLMLAAPDPGGIVSVTHVCWRAISPWIRQATSLLGTAAVTALVLRLTVIGRRRRRASQEYSDLLRLAGHRDVREPATSWLEHSRPLAFSLPGLVAATEGLAEQLTPAEVAAVLEHERTHVRDRHHLLLAVAEAVAWALPFVPLLRQAWRRCRRSSNWQRTPTAARRCGARVLRAALTKVTTLDLPATALVAGNHAVDLRLRRLTDTRPDHGGVARAVRVGMVVALSAAAPLALSTMFTVAALALCP